MKDTRLAKVLLGFSELRVGVLGDFALDLYFDLQQETGEISIETGKAVHHGAAVRASPGAAGTIVNNLVALGVRQIAAFGWVGNDLFGRELIHLLAEQSVITEGLVSDAAGWETYVYMKPIEGTEEASRIDFGTDNQLSQEGLARVMERLETHLPELDVLIVNQQFEEGLTAAAHLDVLAALLARYPTCTVVSDLRTCTGRLAAGIVKSNAHELARMLAVADFDEADTDHCRELIRQAQAQLGRPVVMTRGENGLLYADGKEIHLVPGIALPGKIDVVGAGDACLSALAAGLGSGAPLRPVLEIANLAAAVTVQKLNQTGTASPAEILALAQTGHYHYHTGLAAHLSKARYPGGGNIEQVEALPPNIAIRCAIFDHDGTLSTVREGWDHIMEALMVERICGDQIGLLPPETVAAIAARCHRMIDETTGFPTLMQMEQLVAMIAEYGYTDPRKTESAEAYKTQFIERLMRTVDARMQGLRKGTLRPGEFIMQGAEAFMEKLSARGIELFLASGTDEDHVKLEAAALGYAHRFGERIFGARPSGKDAKRTLIHRLISEEGYTGSQLLIIGDGPAEMREGRRVGAICVGIASDEVQRQGLNPAKRSRLIRAGAHLIISDYSQADLLLEMLS